MAPGEWVIELLSLFSAASLSHNRWSQAFSPSGEGEVFSAAQFIVTILKKWRRLAVDGFLLAPTPCLSFAKYFQGFYFSFHPPGGIYDEPPFSEMKRLSHECDMAWPRPHGWEAARLGLGRWSFNRCPVLYAIFYSMAAFPVPGRQSKPGRINNKNNRSKINNWFLAVC